VVADGKIFAVGGSNSLTREPAEFEQYDPATNRWTILPNMPTPRVFLGAAAVQNRIYTIGGIGDSLDYHATVEVYDLVNNTWNKRADLPTPRNRLAVIAFNGKIYAIPISVLRYDPDDN
jgi:N-acetylneuraminic acid mutarotase